MTDNALQLARRVAEVAPFHVMRLLSRARELEAAGRSIVHMEIGEPDFPTAQLICDAGIRAIENGRHFYTPALGIPELRAAISRFYRERYAVEIPASRIIITSGASGALLLAIGVLIDAGDEVLMADPGYPCNRNFVRMMGGVPAEVPVGAESAYQLLPSMVERHWTSRTKAVMVASPSNPTGTLMPEASLRGIANIARERGGAVIVDEIYHGLVYDGDYTTALKQGDGLFVINSFSKYFNMTGWRLGWMVVPPAYVREFDKLSQNIYLSAPSVSQHAALAAFEPATLAILEARRSEFKARRDFLVPALRELGFRIPVVPPGAFYIYADCSALTADSFTFARELLEGAGVAITPGADFGVHGAARHVRFAYTNAIPVLAEGVKRIGAFIAGK
ncbi:MAG TPA: pyridoxal phosphate-dependent aminotransferase [Burkholderiales bacterium]|nr:pyridoxal phosphate-dependent aminotransferase [Burkholderiales bacterium]